MKQVFIFLLALLYAGTVAGQTPPNWLQSGERERNYPSTVFITGSATGNARAGEAKADAEARLRKDAQAELTEKIRVQVTSDKQKRDTRTKTQTSGKEESEQIHSIFESSVNTSTSLELTGVKTDSYIDDNIGLIYGFAYVNKYELTGYYNASLTMTLQQLESALGTAKQLEANGEKAKARKQYEETASLLVKVEQAQDVLVALDRNASIQRDKTAAWRNDIILALARLSQGVYVYVESKENNFSKNTTVIANQLKSALSKKGCSFTDNLSQADWQLSITATTRHHNSDYGFEFCYADVQVNLVDTRKGKSIFQDEFSQKGSATTQEAAGKKALEEAVPIIVNKISMHIEN